MKQKTLLITILLVSVFSTNLSAQAFKVTDENIVFNLKPSIYCNTSGDGVAMITKYSSTVLEQGADLLWLGFYQNQPNNPGVFSITSISSGSWNSCFKIRANGNVGIFNSYPSEALEIGSIDRTKHVKINGNIIWGSDVRMKDNIKNIPNSLGNSNN